MQDPCLCGADDCPACYPALRQQCKQVVSDELPKVEPDNWYQRGSVAMVRGENDGYNEPPGWP